MWNIGFFGYKKKGPSNEQINKCLDLMKREVQIIKTM